MRSWVLAWVACMVPLSALAQEKPPELTPVIQAKHPVGTASLRKLMLHVYDASFWSDTGGWKTPPYALSITYDMGFSPDTLAERTYEEMKHVSTLPDAKLQQFRDQLRALYPSVEEGDRITAVTLPRHVTQFYHNGRKLGQITDADFATVFFAIWLSPRSSEPGMQQQLTGSAGAHP